MEITVNMEFIAFIAMFAALPCAQREQQHPAGTALKGKAQDELL